MSEDEPTKRRMMVARVLDYSHKVVINHGSKDGVTKGQRYQVYALSDEEIIDPETRESLGHLEVVRGVGRVENVQENMATLVSEETEKGTSTTVVRGADPLAGIMGRLSKTTETTHEPDRRLPFDGPQIGDLVRRVPG